MYFGTKSYLKSNHYHTVKHALRPPNNLTIIFLKLPLIIHLNITIANLVILEDQNIKFEGFFREEEEEEEDFFLY